MDINFKSVIVFVILFLADFMSTNIKMSKNAEIVFEVSYYEKVKGDQHVTSSLNYLFTFRTEFEKEIQFETRKPLRH